MDTKEKTHIESFLNIIEPKKEMKTKKRQLEYRKMLISIAFFLSVFGVTSFLLYPEKCSMEKPMTQQDMQYHTMALNDLYRNTHPINLKFETPALKDSIDVPALETLLRFENVPANPKEIISISENEKTYSINGNDFIEKIDKKYLSKNQSDEKNRWLKNMQNIIERQKKSDEKILNTN